MMNMKLAKNLKGESGGGLTDGGGEEPSTHELVNTIWVSHAHAEPNLCGMDSVGINDLKYEIGGISTGAGKAGMTQVN